MSKINYRLFQELKSVANQNDGQSFHLIKTSSNPMQLMNEYYELENKYCIKLDTNKFNFDDERYLSVEVSGKVIKRFSVV
jgi:hypothetical protein